MKKPKPFCPVCSQALLFLLLFLAASFNVKAQDSILKVNQFKAGLKLLGLGASHERKVSKSATLYFEASLNHTRGSIFQYSYAYVDPAKSSYDYYDGSGYVKTTLEDKETRAWSPLISTEFRQYYNIKNRTSKHKKTLNNSFDFVGLGAFYQFDAKTNLEGINQGSYAGGYLTWGIQKSVSKFLSFEFNIGPGVRKLIDYDKQIEFYINGNLKFDLVIR